MSQRQPFPSRELLESTTHTVARDRRMPVARYDDTDAWTMIRRGCDEHVDKRPGDATPGAHDATDVPFAPNPRRRWETLAILASASPASGSAAWRRERH